MAVDTSEIVATNEMSPAEARHLRSLEGKIERGLQTFREVGMALMEIRESKLYRATHETFEAYCSDRWHLERGRANQLLGAAEVVKAIEATGANTVGPANEYQARELVPLVHTDPEAVRKVWAEVQKAGKPITAEVIREAVHARTMPAGDPGPTETESLVASIQRVGNQYARWNQSKPSRKDRSLVSAALAQLEDKTS